MQMSKLKAIVFPMLLLGVVGAAQAQAFPSWKAYRAQQQAAQAASSNADGKAAVAGQAGQQTSQPAYPASAPYRAPARRPAPENGAAFVGVQAGRGKIYEEVDQRAIIANAGYRWQAGDYSQVGIEVGAGRLDDTSWRDIHIPRVRFNNIGANARFNFGDSRWFGVARLGYWRAKTEDLWGENVTIDGFYSGLGVGVDVNRHFNLQLMYTTYAYSSQYYYDDYEYDINRADTLTFGAEVRF